MYAPPKITSIDWGIKLSHISDQLKPTRPPIPDLNPRNPPSPTYIPLPTHLSLSPYAGSIWSWRTLCLLKWPRTIWYTPAALGFLFAKYSMLAVFTPIPGNYIIVDWQTFVKETLSDTIWRGSTTLVEVSAQSLAAMLSTSQQTFRFFKDNLAKIGGLSIAHEQIWCFLLNSGA